MAELRAARTGDYEQVAGAGFHRVAEALDRAADGDDACDGAVVPPDRGGDGPGKGCVVVHQPGSAAERTTKIADTIDYFQIWKVGSEGLIVRAREYEQREVALEAAGLQG